MKRSAEGRKHWGGRGVWEVLSRPDGTFQLLHNRKSLHDSIPDRWLEDELAKHGFCGQEYREIRTQLEGSGKARIVI